MHSIPRHVGQVAAGVGVEVVSGGVVMASVVVCGVGLKCSVSVASDGVCWIVGRVAELR